MFLRISPESCLPLAGVFRLSKLGRWLFPIKAEKEDVVGDVLVGELREILTTPLVEKSLKTEKCRVVQVVVRMKLQTTDHWFNDILELKLILACSIPIDGFEKLVAFEAKRANRFSLNYFIREITVLHDPVVAVSRGPPQDPANNSIRSEINRNSPIVHRIGRVYPRMTTAIKFPLAHTMRRTASPDPLEQFKEHHHVKVAH